MAEFHNYRRICAFAAKPDFGTSQQSRDDFQATLLNKMQQFECCARGLFLTNLPFLNGRQASVEKPCKYGLANMRTFADALNFCRLQRLQRRKPKRIQLAKRDLIEPA
jgi:hypothetical protein